MKDRLREPRLLEAKIRHGGPEDSVADIRPHQNPQREQTVHQMVAELGLFGRLFVQVQRLTVHGQTIERDVVHRGGGPPELMVKRLLDD